IICGYDTKVYNSSTAVSILSDDDTVNPAAIGQTFLIHNSQIQSCGISGWKGLAENRSNKAKNDGKDLSDTGDAKYWNARTGDQAGPTRVAVAGVDACTEGTDISSLSSSCVMLVPVASNSAHGHAPKCCSQRQLYVVKILAFRIASCG